MAIRLDRLSMPGEGGCRIWTGNCLPKKGYPIVGKGGHGNGNAYAHRVAYVLAFGPIPDGFDIHHACGNVKCINPEHLQALDRKLHRAMHHPAACPHGHEYTAENSYYRPADGIRMCKQCRKLYMREYYLRHKR